VEKRRVTDSAADRGDPKHEEKGEENSWNPFYGVRSSDIEPYTGLRYLSRLFRFMAVILVLLLVAEIVTGLYVQGAAAIPTLLGEAARLIVLAGVLWGTGDLAHLLIDIGHDVRAGRILVTRSTHAGRAALFSGKPADRGSASRIPGDRPLTDRPPPLADRPDEPGGP
jgi:hypothetical protein